MSSTHSINIKERFQELTSMQTFAGKPEDAEELMRQIIEPLLQEDGYVLHGFDTSSYPSIASIFRRQIENAAQPDEIAVEYKFLPNEFVGFQAASSVRRVALSAGVPRSILVTNARFTPHSLELFKRLEPVAFEPIDLDGLRFGPSSKNFTKMHRSRLIR